MNKASSKVTRRRILIILFVTFNAAVILWTALSEFSGGESAVKFRDIKIKWIFIIPAVACWLIAVSAEITKYALIMKKTCGYINIKLAAQTVLLGRYYDNITPSGVGGQPFQIYNLKTNGVPVVQSTVIPITGFLSMQFAFIIVAAFSLAFGSSLVKSDVIRISSYVGLGFYAFFPLLILFLTFFPKPAYAVVFWFVGLLSKLKIVKDKNKTFESLKENISGYSNCILEIIKNAKLCVQTMLLAILYQLALCSMPYFVISAFGGNIGFINCFVTTVAIYSAITFIPTPGNSGVAEGSFYAMFSMITAGYVFWAMMTWRFLCFYSFIIIGLLIYLQKHFEKKKLLKDEKSGNNG